MLEFKKKYLQTAGIYIYICQECKSEAFLHQEYCMCGAKNEYFDKSANVPQDLTEHATEELFNIKYSMPVEEIIPPKQKPEDFVMVAVAPV